MTLNSNLFLKCVSQNPFRILGVTANASKKEIIANVNKFKAFLTVGKHINCPFDTIPGASSVERSVEAIESAEKAIELPLDQLRWSLFWFVNQSSIDKIVFNHISSGNFDKALEIWNKMDNIGSLHNRMLIYLLKGDWYNATLTAGVLFANYSSEVCASVDTTLKLDSKELLNLFFSSLEEEDCSIIPQIYSDLERKGLPYDYHQWIDVLEQIYCSQEISQLSKNIAESKAANRKDTKLMRFYVDVFLNNKNLHRISDLLGPDSSDYIAIASKTASEALQCAIDYFNNSKNQDDVAEETLELVNKVLEMAPIGSMARQRCEDNLETIRDIVSNLPPKEVRYYHKLLQSRIDAYDNEPSTITQASQFLKDCAPYLMSIKATLGANNEYYIKISTRIASAVVNDVIEDFNKQSGKLLPQLKTASGSNRESILRQFKAVLKSATILMYQLQYIGMDPIFKEKRYQPNYNTIKEQSKSVGVIGGDSFLRYFGGGSVSEEEYQNAIKEYALDTRSEFEYYNECKSTSDCYDYIRIFPSGKYADKIQKKIEGLAYNECASLQDIDNFISQYPNTRFDINSKREEIVFKTAQTVNEIRIYLSKYPKAKYQEEAQKRIDDLSFRSCNTRLEYTKYLSDFPAGAHRLEAMCKIDDIDYRDCKTVSDFERYLNNYPNGTHTGDAKIRLEEERLWERCIKKNSWKNYKEYVSRFPKGKYISIAKQKAISPWEHFKNWSSNNGCLLTILIIVAIVLTVAGISNGILGIGYVFCGVAFLGLCGAIGKGNLGTEFRIGSFCVGVVCGIIGYALTQMGESIQKDNEAKIAFKELSDSPTIRDYRNFFNRHYDNLDLEQKDEFVQRYYQASLDSCYATLEHYNKGDYNTQISGLGYLADFVDNCANLNYQNVADAQYNAIVDSLYNQALHINSYDGWIAYQNSVSTDDYKDSEERLEVTDNRWNTEINAWQTASKLDDLTSYEKYLSLFPHGKHMAQAEKKIIDLSVDATFAGSHGTLPEMDQVGYGGGSTSYISVTNSTSYSLTLLYSGKESKRLVLSPNSTGSIRLKNGSYRIAASVNASNVSRYAGTESLNGGSYQVEYYISTSTAPSYRY